MQKIIIDNECLTNQEHYLDFLENKKLWCEYLNQNIINEKHVEIYFTNNRMRSSVETAFEEFLDESIDITFVYADKEDSMVAIKRKWKTINFGYMDDNLMPIYITEIPLPYFDFLEHIIKKEGVECILANIIVIK